MTIDLKSQMDEGGKSKQQGTRNIYAKRAGYDLAIITNYHPILIAEYLLK